MEHLGPTYSDGHYQQLFYVIFSLFCRYVNAEVHTPKASKYAPQDCPLNKWASDWLSRLACPRTAIPINAPSGDWKIEVK